MPDPRRPERGQHEESDEGELVASLVPTHVLSLEPGTVVAQALPLGHSQVTQSYTPNSTPMGARTVAAQSSYPRVPMSSLDYKDQARDYQEVLGIEPVNQTAAARANHGGTPVPQQSATASSTTRHLNDRPYHEPPPPPPTLHLTTPPPTPPSRRTTAGTQKEAVSTSSARQNGNATGLPNVPISAYPIDTTSQKPWYQRYKIHIIGVGAVLLIVIVVVAVVVAGGGADEGGKGSPSLENADSPAPTVSPATQSTDPPIATSCPALGKCFVTNDELARAVEAYINDPSGASTCQEYGHPINNWCVSRVNDFNLLFASGIRQTFNYDISDWDTSNVVTMNGIFDRNEEFNQ